MNKLSYTIYKPKKDGNGSALSICVDEKVTFLNMAKQIPSKGEFSSFGWKDATTNKAPCAVALNESELGDMISVLTDRLPEFSAFHDNKGVKTSISLRPYEKEGKKMGYGLLVARGEFKCSIGIRQGEATVLETLMREGIKRACVYAGPKANS